MKVVINKCFGGFLLSAKAKEWLTAHGLVVSDSREVDRTDSRLVECIEILGEEANGPSATLRVEEFDENQFDYCIDEYDDGSETLCLFPVIKRDIVAAYMASGDVDGLMTYLASIGCHTRN